MKKSMLALVIAVVLFLMAGNLLRYFMPGPLPTRIVTHLGHLNSIGDSLRALVGRAKSANTPDALAKVHAEYDDVQGNFNRTLQHLKDQVDLKALDAADDEAMLSALQARADTLRGQLEPFSKPTVLADAGSSLEVLWKIVEAGATSWGNLIKEGADGVKVADAMLERMHWPDWDKISEK